MKKKLSTIEALTIVMDEITAMNGAKDNPDYKKVNQYLNRAKSGTLGVRAAKSVLNEKGYTEQITVTWTKESPNTEKQD